MAQAVKRLYPKVKLAIGPAIDDGFYYDFETPEPFTPQDVEAIEKEMKKIVKENLKIERFTLSKDEARALMKDEPYKLELIDGLEGEPSFYKQGEFTDLCAGPHLGYTARVKAFKLLSVAGAYWRGDEKNKMLSRIYGTAFPTKEELEAHLARLEEAKKRDHRKLGKEMNLFALMDEGPGFPFFLPKGVILRNNLIEYWRKLHKKYGYQEITTPIMLMSDLWKRSGHWEHYRENMYGSVVDDVNYQLKPMNCPGGMLVYNLDLHSYKEFPLRVAELGMVHRHEKSGTLHGLFRVRVFTQDDAHIFMTDGQLKDEIIGVINLYEEVYNKFGLKFYLELSTKPENSIGTDEDWERATEPLRHALAEKEMPYRVNEGDGAFYGPKIDFHLEDSIGRTWQCGTIQVDMQMPELFDLNYIGADGNKHRPVMIHRACFGSIERFIGILTEHFAGWFPFWLAPVQAVVLPISERHHEAAKNLFDALNEAGIRAEIDARNEKIGFKIREAQMQRIPYMLVIGDKEVEERTVSVRSREKGDEGARGTAELIEDLKAQNVI
ncbi:MAG: threonine--tRNA ligase, partial [Clostridiales bacterium]|jgi:threonyl-tRNA synthetase|nr:threonine--tRNA ligase [Clostridiales bacterium]